MQRIADFGSSENITDWEHMTALWQLSPRLYPLRERCERRAHINEGVQLKDLTTADAKALLWISANIVGVPSLARLVDPEYLENY